MIPFTCACGQSLKAPDASAGKKIKCPGCGKVAFVPVQVGAGPVNPETAALPSPDPQATIDERPTDPATSDFNAMAALPGSASRRDVGPSSAQAAGATRTLGGYRIVRELGHGGMGTVYEAEDVKLERRVALKVMQPEIAKNPQHRERFLREACTAASVESDFICPIYEVGEDDGVPFIAMPFLKGEPLNALWKKHQRLAPGEVVRIGKDVAEGLSAAHAAGLVHRDIKPANIWMETQPSGPPRSLILDFGLARVQADNVQITQSGAIIGTPAYMSPEQARGEKNVDARTDLFSLGCVLYALCTGELPFQGKTMMDVLLALATHEPAPPHAISATIPQPLSHLILRLLAKNPDDRPRTAREVIDELTAVQRDLAPPAQATLTTRIKPAAKSGSKTLPTSKDADKTEVVSPSPLGRKTSYAVFALIAVGVLGCVIPLLGGGIYYVVTDNGTIEIMTEDDKVQVLLLKNGQEIEILDGASKKTWSIRTGKYTVRLKDDPDTLEIVMPDTFELKRGGKHLVTIRKNPYAEVKAVVTQLKKLNPRFDGNVTPTIVGGVVTGLKFLTDEVDNISPVRSLKRLISLDCRGTSAGKRKLSDLSPLKGMQLTSLDVSFSQVQDLTPLKGMPLTRLNLYACQVRDAEPLKGMPLTILQLTGCQVQDLDPLKGMPLTFLNIENTQVRDVTPLRGSPLTSLNLLNCRVRNLEPLKDMPLTHLDLRGTQVHDLKVLKGMPLISVWLGGCGEVRDLEPLEGMKLTELLLEGCTQVRDLEPLKGMPLKRLLIQGTAVTDLKPLQGMPLEEIRLTPKNTTQGLDILRDMQSLKDIGIAGNQIWPAEKFWALDIKPADNAERVAIADVAYAVKQFAVAARLWAEALETDPKLGDDRQGLHRYGAARAAALAAAGQGKDESPLDDAAKVKLRGQALDWLKAELSAWTKVRESGARRRD